MQKNLEVRNISAGYDKKEVISDISFSARCGEITTLIGPNGSGKSTLLKSICSIIKPYSGSITYSGEDLSNMKASELAKKISYLPQNRDIPNIIVESLVLHGRFPYLSYPRIYRKEDYQIVREILSRVGLEDKRERRMEELSGGERQKVYLAMCLAQGTDIMLFDEPTTFFDIGHQYQFLDEARRLSNEGKCVILVLHDIAQALESSDKLVVLENGRSIAEGRPEDIYEHGTIQKVFGVGIEKHLSHYFTYRI